MQVIEAWRGNGFSGDLFVRAGGEGSAGDAGMRVLVACEQSQVVTEAFTNLGHDAMSCDLHYPGAKGLPHYQGNALDLLNDGWDLMIAHPPVLFCLMPPHTFGTHQEEQNYRRKL